MASPQPGIFVEGTLVHWFQEYEISRTADLGVIRAALAAAIRARNLDGDRIELVVGLGQDLANQLGLDVPDDFRSFETVGTGARSATSTQHDLFVWIHGDERGAIFDAAVHARRMLTEVGAIVGDVPGFIYKDNRDLTGFIDGTENPEAHEALSLAVVGDGLAGEGGSTVLVQRWDHNLDLFHSLPVTDQEAVIGRTKPDSIELDETALPDNSHVARVVMEDDEGEEIEVYRRSVPWGDSTDSGLMFVGFTDKLAKIDNMVRAMFGADDDVVANPHGDAEVYDRLTDFTVARTSSYFFAPSIEALKALVTA